MCLPVFAIGDQAHKSDARVLAADDDIADREATIEGASSACTPKEFAKAFETSNLAHVLAGSQGSPEIESGSAQWPANEGYETLGPMITAHIPSDETQRLQCLETLRILDTPPDPAFDAITRLAAERLDCPIALLSLVDEHRQWFKSRSGFDPEQSSREEAFCAHAILDTQQFVVADASADPRFSDNPLVTGPQQIRFYAGQPLLVNGLAIGTLCVLDRSPRKWSIAERRQLASLTAIVEALLTSQWRERQAQIEVARLSEFAQVSTSLLWECDPHLRITWVNSAMRAIFGGSLDDIVGDLLFDGAPLDELGRVDAAGLSLRERLMRADGRPIAGAFAVETAVGKHVLGVSVTPVLGRGQRLIGWRGVARDVQTSVDARRQRQELESAESLRQRQMEFMARVSHELRTPLNAILSFCHLIQRDIGSSVPPHCVRWLDLVQMGGAHLVALTEDLMTFCRDNRQMLNLTEISISAVAEQAVELLEPLSQQCKVAVQVEAEPFVVVHADACALRQIMFNVVGNAIKYSPAGGSVKVTCTTYQGMGVVEVADTGIGIPKDRLHKLFTPFERLGAEHTGIPGTGLGLAIAKTLVDSMDGTIEAESPDTGGCRIRVALRLSTMPLQ